MLTAHISFTGVSQEQGSHQPEVVDLPCGDDIFPAHVRNWPASGTIDNGYADIHHGRTYRVRSLAHRAPSSIAVGQKDRIRVLYGPIVVYGNIMEVVQVVDRMALCIVSGWVEAPVTAPAGGVQEEGTHSVRWARAGTDIRAERFAVVLPEVYVVYGDPERMRPRHLSVRLFSTDAAAADAGKVISRGVAGAGVCAGTFDTV